MEFIIKLLISSLAVVISAYLLPGVSVKSFLTALVVALVLGLLNAFVYPLMVVLTIPITIVTFGLFLFVLNALVIMLAAWIIPGFSVDGFWWALLFSIILTLVVSLLRIVVVY